MTVSHNSRPYYPKKKEENSNTDGLNVYENLKTRKKEISFKSIRVVFLVPEN